MLDPSILQTLSNMADAADAATLNATRGNNAPGPGLSDVDASSVDAARASYSKFWNIQTASQPDADATQSAVINGLNARIHAAWGRLENFLAEFDDPSTWQSHAKASQEAFADAAQLSKAAGQSPQQAASYGIQQAQAAQTPIDAQRTYINTSYGAAFSDQVGKITDTLSQSFLGVPVWAWGALALGSVYLILKER